MVLGNFRVFVNGEDDECEDCLLLVFYELGFKFDDEEEGKRIGICLVELDDEEDEENRKDILFYDMFIVLIVDCIEG